MPRDFISRMEKICQVIDKCLKTIGALESAPFVVFKGENKKIKSFEEGGFTFAIFRLLRIDYQ